MQCIYEKPDYPLHLELQEPSAIDLLVTVGKPTSTPMMKHDLTPRGYEEQVPIKIYAINKTGISGSLAVWEGEDELRRIVDENPTGSQRGLKGLRDNDQNLGSTTLYCTECLLTYRRDTT